MPTKRQLASDTFVRANGGLGANWTTQTGSTALQIVSNTVQNPTPSSNGLACYSANGSLTDQWASVKVIAVDSADFAGPMVRAALGAFTAYLGLVEVGVTQTCSIAKRVAGTFTSLASGSFTIAANDIIELWVIGSVLTLFQNGSQILTATDSSIASGYPGMIEGNQIATESLVQLSNFLMGDFGGGAEWPQYRKLRPDVLRRM